MTDCSTPAGPPPPPICSPLLSPPRTRHCGGSAPASPACRSSTRRRASVILDPGSGPCLLVTKGAVSAVLDACTAIRLPGGEQPLTGAQAGRRTSHQAPGRPRRPHHHRDRRRRRGRRRALPCHRDPPGEPVTGADTARLDDRALAALAERTTIFAEASPLHKARIVRALLESGHVVGYLGDGINDTPALRAADIGLAVPEAADVARQASDAILLDKDLRILRNGVTAARHATLNATKYLKATVSANLGNVLSILAASAFLPFLPMLPLQILVQNLVYDIAQLTLPLDHADQEQLTRPHRWSGRDLTIFIACFAPLSSAFDLVTFALLQHLPAAGAASHQMLFHAGWFTESLLTQTLAVLVIRTGRIPLLHSRPAAAVGLACLAGTALALSLPYTPAGTWLGLAPLPPTALAVVFLIVTAYLTALQAAKIAYQRATGRWL